MKQEVKLTANFEVSKQTIKDMVDHMPENVVQIVKSNIFQAIAKHVTEKAYEDLKMLERLDVLEFRQEFYLFTLPEFQEFLQDLKDHPNKFDDLLRINKKRLELAPGERFARIYFESLQEQLKAETDDTGERVEDLRE